MVGVHRGKNALQKFPSNVPHAHHLLFPRTSDIYVLQFAPRSPRRIIRFPTKDFARRDLH